MRACPACNKWTLDFDDYFGRYRCFNPGCEWMAASTTEREIQCMRKRYYPKKLCETELKGLNLTLSSYYDNIHDALLFDFGLKEPTVDFPEPDGRLIWQIGRDSRSIAGFTLLQAKSLGVSQVFINLAGRKESIESKLRQLVGKAFLGRPSRMLIEEATVCAAYTSKRTEMDDAVEQTVQKFQEQFC